MAYTYETVDGTKSGFVTGHGAIVDGKITSETAIENPNLKLVGGAPVSGTASQQNPAQPQTAEQAPANNGEQA